MIQIPRAKKILWQNINVSLLEFVVTKGTLVLEIQN
jgi:hypothetical protein